MALNIDLDGFEYITDSDANKMSPTLKQPPISPIESESSSGISSLDSDDLKVREKSQAHHRFAFSPIAADFFSLYFFSLSLLVMCEAAEEIRRRKRTKKKSIFSSFFFLLLSFTHT